MPTMPSRDVIRFWLQNCNGMITASDISRYIFEIQQYNNHNIHYLSFTETRLNPSHMHTTYQTEHGFTQLVKHGRLDIKNTPGFTPSSSYQPGGVAAAFHGRLADRYSKTIRDTAGRWIIQEFIGKEKTLRVYTLYRVNPKTYKADISAWSQQKRRMQKNDIDDDPRTRVIDDLIADITLSIQNGCSILLFGDLNEQVTGREKTNKRLFQIGLHDVMQNKLGTDNLPRTHCRGNGAIDHVWVTAAMLPSIVHAGYAPFDFIGNSDHRGIYVDINLCELLDFNSVPLQCLSNRRLQTSIPKRVDKYIQLL